MSCRFLKLLFLEKYISVENVFYGIFCVIKYLLISTRILCSYVTTQQDAFTHNKNTFYIELNIYLCII
jgi:hypothetical protein